MSVTKQKKKRRIIPVSCRLAQKTDDKVGYMKLTTNKQEKTRIFKVK